MNQQHKCPTVLLEDTPALEDGFNSHEPVARAIAELIFTESGGKYIGLEGDWGSGKSTVVNLLERALSSKAETKVIRFDAWSHQGDPLRRSFLETLIGELGSWVDEEKWCGRREELAGRRESSKTTKSSVLYFWGKLLISSMVLMPVGLLLIKASLDLEPIPLWWGREVDWTATSKFIWGALFLMLPLLLILIRRLCMCERVKRWLKSGPRRKMLVDPDEAADPWCIFADQFDSVTTSSTIKSQDPTSVEFRTRFVELMAEALANRPDAQVVLVLDNLDRIARTDALSMWATMQTFLSTSEYEKESWFGHVWVIVPYDRNGINKLWDQSQESVVCPAEKAVKGKTIAGKDRDSDDTAAHFLDKTFQIVFQVPPLSLSDWRRYLREQLLARAFKQHDSSAFDEVCSLYAVRRERDGRIPTPRELILFVNQIGALHRRWAKYEGTDNEIGLVHMAHYVLLRRDKHNTTDSIISDLRSGGDLAKEIDVRFGKEDRVKFAALVFGVDVKRAQQLLLRDTIATALERGQPEELKKYVDYPGFWDVLDIMQIASLIGKDSTRLSNFAYAIANMGVEIDVLRSERWWIVAQFSRAISAVDSWVRPDADTARGVGEALKIVRTQDAAAHVLRAIQNSQIKQTAEGTWNTREWIEGLVVTLRVLDDLSLKEAYSNGITVPVSDATEFIAACGYIGESDPDGHYWPVLRTTLGPEEIASVLAEFQPNAGLLRMVRLLRAAAVNVNWDAVTKATVALLSSSSVAAEHILHSLQALWELRDVLSTQARLTGLVIDGSMIRCLQNASAAGEERAAALSLFLYLREFVKAKGDSTFTSRQDVVTALNAILAAPSAALVMEYVSLWPDVDALDQILFALDIDPNVKPMVNACLSNMAEGANALAFFTAETLVRHWRHVRGGIAPQKLRNLLQSLITREGFVGRIESQGFRTDRASLYEALIQLPTVVQSPFAQWCAQGLKDLNVAIWTSQITQRGTIVVLMIRLLDLSIPLLFGDAYRQALGTYMLSVVDQSGSTNYSHSEWVLLFRPLESELQRDVRSEILQKIIGSPQSWSQQLFDRFEEVLRDADLLKSNPQTVERLFASLLKSKTIYKVKLVSDALVPHPEILTRYKGETPGAVQEFRRLVSNFRSTVESKDVRRLIDQIGEVIGAKPEKNAKRSRFFSRWWQG